MNNYLVPGFFFAGTLFFIYLTLTGPAPDSAANGRDTSTTQKGVPYNRVNQYRRETEVAVDIRRERAAIGKERARPELDPSYRKRKKFHDSPVETTQSAAARELDQGKRTEPLNLDQRLDAFLAKKQAFEEMEEAKRREFVERFIKESVKMGYDVQVNDRLEIIKFEKR